MKLSVTVNGKAYTVDVEVEEETPKVLGSIITGGSSLAPTQTASVPATSSNAVTAPLSGSVNRILVEQGQAITAGEELLVLEAMKMETKITAPHDGTVTAILVEAGEAVSGGQALIEVS